MPEKFAPSLLLVAINGYGMTYVRAYQELREKGAARLAGIVDPMASRCAELEDLTRDGAAVYERVEDFLQAGGRADLALIASPIQFHCEQTCAALDGGMNVLCEKPLGALTEEADLMQAAVDRTGRFAAIGYQWSFSQAVTDLKRDILAGRFGAPKRFKTVSLRQRLESYFTRNSWAGRIRDASGRWVLDSPVNNADAHYLHNMLYLLGDRLKTSAVPVEITAELGRANRIENFDTCALRAKTDRGVEVLFYTSHATERTIDPVFELECEYGRVVYDSALENAEIVATFSDGSVRNYGDPGGKHHGKVYACLDALRDPANVVPCGIAAARGQTVCVDRLRSVPVRVYEENELVRVEKDSKDRVTCVKGLTEAMLAASACNRLPSENGSTAISRAVTLSV